MNAAYRLSLFARRPARGVRLAQLSATLLAVFMVSGCAQFQTVTVADANSAIAVATATGDTAAVPCYQALGALAAAPTAPGLLTKYEVVRGAQTLAEGPCSEVFAGLGVHILGKVPFLP